jgi:phenylacetate-CoA ligase
MADLERTEFSSFEELRDLQSKRMISQLRFALEQVPYYQEMYSPFAVQIKDISRWEDVDSLICELPCVTKDQVQSDADRFYARGIKRMRTYPDKTSGSAGTPLQFPCDQEAWAYRHAHTFRALRMHDVQVGEPYALFFGLHWAKRSRSQVALRDRVFNRVRVSAFDISKTTFEAHLKRIRDHRPAYFLGYPSALYDFCFLAQEFGVDLRELKLKLVFTTAEPLLSYQRDMIQEVTGSRCVSQYGSAEGGFTAFECPAGNMHIAVETTWLRPLDRSKPVSEALVTDMMLRAFPLINYAIGDEVRLKAGSCSCGRAHPTIESIQGRSGEPILLPNGRRINANLPSYIFKPLASLKVIRRYRFVQRGENLDLFLVVSNSWKREHLDVVKQEVHAAFGPDISFAMHVVSELENLPNAKHRCYVTMPVEQELREQRAYP